jgi:hypothetical protein
MHDRRGAVFVSITQHRRRITMETAAIKALIVKVLQEAFDECVQTWNLEELEEKNLADALFGPDTIERIFNVTQISSLYSDEGKILIQGELKSVSAPTLSLIHI